MGKGQRLVWIIIVDSWFFRNSLHSNAFRGSGAPRQCVDAALQPYLQAESQHVRQWTYGRDTLWRQVCRSLTTPATTSLLICSGLKLWVEICRAHSTPPGIMSEHLPSRFIMSILVRTCHFFIQIESLEQGKLTEFLSQEQTEQMWQLCTKRLSRYKVSSHTTYMFSDVSFKNAHQCICFV